MKSADGEHRLTSSCGQKGDTFTAAGKGSKCEKCTCAAMTGGFGQSPSPLASTLFQLNVHCPQQFAFSLPLHHRVHLLVMESPRASPSLDLMHHAAAVTPLPDEQAAPAALPEKISAYFSLTFPNFTYYIQTISIAIGRRAARDSSPSSSDSHQVDVDLGPLRSVSRLHAKIEYEESQERFVLVVLGRNGAWVDGIWSGSGSRVPLGAK